MHNIALLAVLVDQRLTYGGSQVRTSTDKRSKTDHVRCMCRFVNQCGFLKQPTLHAVPLSLFVLPSSSKTQVTALFPGQFRDSTGPVVGNCLKNQ